MLEEFLVVGKLNENKYYKNYKIKNSSIKIFWKGVWFFIDLR